MKTRLFVLLLVVLLVGFQELVLRALFPLPEVTNFNRIHYSKVASGVFSEMKRLRRVSNRAFVWRSDPDGAESVHGLNRYGFRDRDWSVVRTPGMPRVMFVGDSILEGFMAGDDQTIPRVFSRRAQERGIAVEPLNFGVAGAQVPDYLRLIRDALPLFRPESLIVVFYANDLPAPPLEPRWADAPLVPDFAHSYLPRGVNVIRDLWNGEAVTCRWRGRPLPFIAAVPDPSNPWSYGETVAYAGRFVAPDVATAMTRGRFNPHVVNEYSGYRRHLVSPVDLGAHLRALSAFAESHGTQLLVAYIPSRSQVSDAYLPFQAQYDASREVSSLMGPPYQMQSVALKQNCGDLGIPFLDLSPALRHHEEHGDRMFWNFDEHLRAEGDDVVGRALFDWWQTEDGGRGLGGSPAVR